VCVASISEKADFTYMLELNLRTTEEENMRCMAVSIFSLTIK